MMVSSILEDRVYAVRVVEFNVAGTPQQQGSKNQFGAESNAAALHPWRGSVAAEAKQALGDEPLFEGAVKVDVIFIYARPKSHFRTGKNARLLRDVAPFYKSTAPDLDKLQRAIGDALTGVLIRDDSQIAAWNTRKVYGTHSGASISVRTLP